MIINIKVKPNSGKQSIELIGDVYIIGVKSSPENNKANTEVIKLLEKHFNKKVKIKSGMKGRHKIVEVG